MLTDDELRYYASIRHSCVIADDGQLQAVSRELLAARRVVKAAQTFAHLPLGPNGYCSLMLQVDRDKLFEAVVAYEATR